MRNILALATLVLAACGPLARSTAIVRVEQPTPSASLVVLAPPARMTASAAARIAPTVLAYGEIALYEDVDFGGREWIVNGDAARFVDIDGLNDVVSSIRVGPGTGASVYEHVGFEGRRIWIEADVPSLIGSGLGNDVASSARVRAALVPGRVALYEHVGYEGREWVLDGDAIDFAALDGALNDRISSFRVGPRTSVTIFADAGFHGESASFDRNVPTILETPFANDTASAAKISTR